MPFERNIVVELPVFHIGQERAFDLEGRFKAIRCGRRWGKTDYGKVLACDGAIHRQLIGWFAPDYKRLSETYNEIVTTLAPVLPKGRGNKVENTVRTLSGGRIDFWTLNDEHAGRSRKYHQVLIDEAAFTAPNMMDIWRLAIRPTLIDYKGSCTVFSNTNGIADDNFFWQICNQPQHGFVEYHATSMENPFLPAEELEALAGKYHPLAYQQEILAEFVDWSGIAFFSKDKLLHNAEPVPYPARCDAVFATVDTATKTGQEHDGTAVIYWALISYGLEYKLVILDWDIVQVEGALLEVWLPSVFARINELATMCNSRVGSAGAWIEDKASGMVLLQQGANRGWPVQAIDSKLTSVGKSERAINVSGYVYQGLVKISKHAWEKVSTYKETSRNHMTKQVFGFRVGAKDDDDDLLDTFCYGVAIGLGNQQGF